MNIAFIQSLDISQQELSMLAKIPHHWIEVKGGAVVFFARDGRAHFLAYSMAVLPDEKRAAFWEAVGRLPRVREIETRFLANPVTAEEFAQWD